MKNLTIKICLVAMTMLVPSAFQQSAMAQDFLGIFEKITDKNFDDFVANWEHWSAMEAELARNDARNELTSLVVSDISEGSDYVKRYNENSKYTVLQYELTVTQHADKLNNRRPPFDRASGETVKIRPYAETGKPILYLNTEIATLLDKYIKSDTSGKRKEKVKALFNIVADNGGYHYCSVPFVAALDFFADCAVVEAREGWGNGNWIKYVQSYKKAEVIGEWMR